MTQLHENIDKGNVSLLMQQFRGDRAESCVKLLSVLCHRLYIPFALNGEDDQPCARHRLLDLVGWRNPVESHWGLRREGWQS